MLFFKSTGGVKYLIVGLGNPGPKYDGTRHNAGFEVIDRLAKRAGCSLSKNKFNSLFGRCVIGGADCLLVKPQTYMNRSGEAVKPLADFYKIPVENIIVIADDISLEPGRLRIRRKGSPGGHKGLENISTHMGDDFPRIKLGVGAKPHPDYDLAAWVVAKFGPDDSALFAQAADKACDAVELMVSGEIDKAMNRFNC